MKQPAISIESISDDLIAAYAVSGMERGKAGRHAIEWAFGKNPAAFAVARENGQIVGVSAYIRSRMHFGASNGFALQAVDSFVSESMRGRGVFSQLASSYNQYAEREGADLVWGFPNDNAAPAWFGKLGWHSHGQVPFMFKPLRAGILLRKLRIPGSMRTTFARDQGLAPASSIGAWADEMWEAESREIGCGTIRDGTMLQDRLFAAPQVAEYRVVVDDDRQAGSLVAVREAQKHGGHIAYLMEAMGTARMKELLMSELGRLCDNGVELVLAWSFPWSPNYRTLRSAGFMPLPERLRPIRIWFGTRPQTAPAHCASVRENWYLSYLDSDTV